MLIPDRDRAPGNYIFNILFYCLSGAIANNAPRRIRPKTLYAYTHFTLHDRYHGAANSSQKQSNRGAIALIPPRNPAKNAKPSMTAIAPQNPAKNDKRSMTAIATRLLSSHREIRPKTLSDHSHRAAKSGQKRYAILTAIVYKFLQG